MMPNIPPVWQMGGATRKGKGPEKIKKVSRRMSRMPGR
jgi:hypothetical protein